MTISDWLVILAIIVAPILAVQIQRFYEMAKSLNYTFDKVHLARGVYIPKGQADYMMSQEFMRRAFVEVLSGTRSIPIKVINVVKDDTVTQISKTETIENQEK